LHGKRILRSSVGKVVKRSTIGNLRPDFGTYHHTTPSGSEKAREKFKSLFKETFGDLPFSHNANLKILDMGCGLGFLSCVCAEHYPNARITAFDTFEHASLKDSSLVKAKNNARILGFSERISFQKRDFFRSDYSKGKFDLFVSNLVFENFGKKRLDAYERLAKWATPKSYAVLSEIFFDYEADFKQLTNLFGNIQVRPDSTIRGRTWTYKMLVLSEPTK
jgi:ribosomal protein L11 methylase PrmA